jgi:hypothetical protein
MLMGLADLGFTRSPLAEMQKSQRAEKATAEARKEFTDRQQAFVDLYWRST